MCIVICTLLLSRPARGAWVEIQTMDFDKKIRDLSRPARGAWVEIPSESDMRPLHYVAPRKGRVG